MCTGHMLICCFEKIKTINYIKDAQKLKFLAKAEKKETLGRISNTVFLFFPIFCQFFTIAYIKQSKCAFYCFVLLFREKSITKQQFKNIYLNLNFFFFANFIPTKHI